MGGPLPFPDDAGRQVFWPILPFAPSQGDSWITRGLAAKASDSVDYGKCHIALVVKNLTLGSHRGTGPDGAADGQRMAGVDVKRTYQTASVDVTVGGLLPFQRSLRNGKSAP
jgi:hypothetical protein